MRTFLLFGVFITLAASAHAATGAVQVGDSCHLNGIEEGLRCTRISVPLDYQHEDGDSVSLHVTVAPSIKENAKPDPLFVLAGGPGQAGSEIVMLLEHAFSKVRQNRDIIFIDQRGTGRSGKLLCAQADQIDELPSSQQEDAIKQCLREIPGNKNHYSTDNAARDIDRVRAALGYQTINVWGGSYGSRLAQAYARWFPANTRALLLDGVASPQQLVGLWGADAQASLDAMFAHCAADSACTQTFPQLKTQWQQLLQSLSGDQFRLRVTHPRTGKTLDDVMPLAAFVETIRTMLYSASAQARMPLVISRAAEGDWGPFAQMAYSSSDFSTQSMAFGLTFSVLCGEDIYRIDNAMLAQDEKSFLRATTIKQWIALCPLLSITRRDTPATDIIDAPTLLLSGALDPVTPPTRAEQAMQFIKTSQHFIAPNVGHIVSNSGCADRLLKQFVDDPTQALDGKCLTEIPLPSFVLSNAGAAP